MCHDIFLYVCVCTIVGEGRFGVGGSKVGEVGYVRNKGFCLSWSELVFVRGTCDS